MRNLREISFPGKREDEKVLLLLRRHWIILLAHGIVSLILLIVPIGGALILRNLIPSLQTTTIYPFLVLLFWIYLMFVWSYFFVGWIDYYLDAWIVTNDRIINIEQNGLFNRVISEQRLYRVQDVTAVVSGPIQTFFNFGKVYIQTAAEMERFVFEDVPEPYQVKKIIIELHEKALEAEYARQAAIDTTVATNEEIYHAEKKKFYLNPEMMTPDAATHEKKEMLDQEAMEQNKSTEDEKKRYIPHPHEID
jgi:membrane protein YdbS with pleckstrin-like domain